MDRILSSAHGTDVPSDHRPPLLQQNLLRHPPRSLHHQPQTGGHGLCHRRPGLGQQPPGRHTPSRPGRIPPTHPRPNEPVARQCLPRTPLTISRQQRTPHHQSLRRRLLPGHRTAAHRSDTPLPLFPRPGRGRHPRPQQRSPQTARRTPKISFHPRSLLRRRQRLRPHERTLRGGGKGSRTRVQLRRGREGPAGGQFLGAAGPVRDRCGVRGAAYAYVRLCAHTGGRHRPPALFQRVGGYPDQQRLRAGAGKDPRRFPGRSGCLSGHLSGQEGDGRAGHVLGGVLPRVPPHRHPTTQRRNVLQHQTRHGSDHGGPGHHGKLLSSSGTGTSHPLPHGGGTLRHPPRRERYHGSGGGHITGRWSPSRPDPAQGGGRLSSDSKNGGRPVAGGRRRCRCSFGALELAARRYAHDVAREEQGG
mmetsp:Transcript_12269/g.26827  ORF Transcript_12269/g.26827 Transcript_12269/m.26827 type:complete len:418 (+) Transcript_12269:1422-2675(+)